MVSSEGKFRIATKDRGYVEYRVRSGGQYTLGWDKNKGVWDLKMAKAAPAQPTTSPVAQASVASFELRNQSNQTLPFQTLDPSRGTWKDQSVYPNESKTFNFAPGVQSGKIRIGTTGRGYVQYDVRAGWKYSLMWDQAKGVWDFKTLQRGS